MNVDYNSLNDFDFEDTNMDEVTLKEIRQIQSDIVERLDRIEKLVSQYGQVENLQMPKGKAGRKKSIMFYEDKEIDDKELVYLVDKMGVAPCKILNDFYYIKSDNTKIDNRDDCRDLIASRLNKERRKKK